MYSLKILSAALALSAPLSAAAQQLALRETPTGTLIPARYRTRSAIEHSVVAHAL